MKSADIKDFTQKKADIRQKITDAVKKNDVEAAAQAWNELFDCCREETEASFEQKLEELRAENDHKIRTERGERQLTGEEKKYYQTLLDTMRAKDPKQALANIDLTFPETVINTVFDELRTNHPLLSEIDFRTQVGNGKIISDTSPFQMAVWGELCDEIVTELSAGFSVVDAALYKLSAFIPVCKPGMQIGPEWLDRYVRGVLYEAYANGLTYGYIMGDGDDKPIGMIRQVGAGVTVVGGVYPKKDAIVVTDLSAKTVGGLIGMLAVNPAGKPRAVGRVILVVNPADYYTKVMPATTVMGADGTYRNDVLPYPMRVIPDPSVDVGEALLGIGKRYLGTAAFDLEGRIEYSDHVKFLQDKRVYIIKGYGNGMPKDNKAFLRLDISGLRPAVFKFENVTPADPDDDATLAFLDLAGLTLSPAFDADEDTYTASTTAASSVINAIPANAAQTIGITLTNTTHATGVAVTNGSSVSFDTGSNVIAVTVTAEDGSTTETYTVTVTKS